VVKDHPDLYDRLNTYLDALAEETRAEARLETLRDIDAMLNGVTGPGAPAGGAAPGSTYPGSPTSGSALTALVPRFATQDEQQILLSILGRLDSLLK
ncbi:MAG TPA: hypothetical protein VMF68_13895, partial [Spirochaetia bacterium]|nr:hypothetical protein [Spirochaetia bacterium]